MIVIVVSLLNGQVPFPTKGQSTRAGNCAGDSKNSGRCYFYDVSAVTARQNMTAVAVLTC